jgi:hypothetical protein
MAEKKSCSDYTYQLVKNVMLQLWNRLHDLRNTKKAENRVLALTEPERKKIVSDIFDEVGPSVSKVKDEMKNVSNCSQLITLMVLNVMGNIDDSDKDKERLALKGLIDRLRTDKEAKLILMDLQDKIEGNQLNWSRGGRRSSKKHHRRKSAKRSRRKSAKRSRRKSRK